MEHFKVEAYKILITFPSVSYAIKLDRANKKMNNRITLIPTPREITTSCGMSALVVDSLENIEKTLQNEGIKIENKYKVIMEGNTKKYVIIK